MQAIFPKKLKKGDTIGLLSVAGAIDDFNLIEKTKKYFLGKGFNVVLSKNCFERNRYLSGSDFQRADALNEFFADRSVDAIIALRGGYGSIRILDNIDYTLIKSNPKIFAGYSDITALSLMIFKNTGLVTFSSPMGVSDFANDIDLFSENSFWNTFQNGISKINLVESNVYKKGNASGILWGGNLSTIQSLCGLDFLPTEKFIFVVEDVNEPVYKIDKMFCQLFNISDFKNNVAAIVLGDFTGIDSQEYYDELMYELADLHDIPVVSGLKFGHEKSKLTFPIGASALLNIENREILFNQTFEC